MFFKLPAVMLLCVASAVGFTAESSAQNSYGANDAQHVTSSRDPTVLQYVICLEGEVSATARSVRLADALAGAAKRCETWARQLPRSGSEPNANEIQQSILECGFRPGDASPDADCGQRGSGGGSRAASPPAMTPMASADRGVLRPDVIELGINVEGIAFDGNWLWAAESGQRTIARIDLAKRSVAGRVKVGRLPVGMASTGNGEAFALVQTDNAIWRQSPGGQGSVFAKTPDCPNGMVVRGNNLWVLSQPGCTSEHSRVSRIDARTGQQAHSADLGNWAQALTTFGSQVWVAHVRGPALSVVDANSLRASPVDIAGAEFWTITANPGSVYAGGRISGTQDDGLVVMIDPSNRTEIARARVGERVASMVGDDENVVVIGDKGTIWVLSAQNLALRRTITLSTGPFAPRAMAIVREQLLVTAGTFRGENGAVFVLRDWWPSARGGGATVQDPTPNRFAGPSFSCATARSVAERAICANHQLAALDRGLEASYTAALGNLTVAEGQALKREQRDWLGFRDRCHDDEGCLIDAYQSRTRVLDGLNQPRAVSPQAAAPAPPSTRPRDQETALVCYYDGRGVQRDADSCRIGGDLSQPAVMQLRPRCMESAGAICGVGNSGPCRAGTGNYTSYRVFDRTAGQCPGTF